MADRKQLEENAEDAFLALLMSDFAESEGAYYIAENERLQNDPSAAVPEDVDRRILQFIEREMAKQKRSVHGDRAMHIIGRFLIAAAIAVLLFVAAYAVSPTVCTGTLNFLMQFDSKMATWQFDVRDGASLAVTASDKNIAEIAVDWVPDGYVRQGVIVTGPRDFVLDLTNEEGGIITISAHVSEFAVHTMDLEEADHSDIKVQGCDGVLISKNGTWRIVWSDAETGCVITIMSSDADADTLLLVAENVHNPANQPVFGNVAFS